MKIIIDNIKNIIYFFNIFLQVNQSTPHLKKQIYFKFKNY